MESSNIKTGKKLINTAESCVDDFLEGYVTVNNLLKLQLPDRIIFRSDYEDLVKNNHVTVICGGGSGHEPAFAGYVGKGMLTAAVAGPVFASPPVSAIYNAIQLIGNKSNEGGTIVIVPNYTGDRLNFGLAIEKAKAAGYRVGSVIVGDDCALVSSDKSAGRRGLAGLMLAIKVAGAMSEESKKLEEILEVLNKLTLNIGTIGLCLKECSIPGCNPSFVLEENEMSLGLGAHGEAGVSKINLLSAKESVNIMFNHMTNIYSASCLALNKSDKVVLLINNLGSTTTLETGIIAKEAIAWLENNGIEVLRVFLGHMMTSLEMAGVAFTVLKDAEMYIKFIDAQTSASSWPKVQQCLYSANGTSRNSQVLIKKESSQAIHNIIPDIGDNAITIDKGSRSLFLKCITKVCNNIIEAKEELNDLDRDCGDGDCGNTLSSGAEAILKALDASQLELDIPFYTLQQLSSISCQTMGGASGAIFGIFFAAASVPLKTEWSVKTWGKALSAGANAVSKHGGAEPGDRTLLDPLDKIIKSFEAKDGISRSEAARLAASFGQLGAENTMTMKARAGRASYVPENLCKRMDPGAKAVAIIANTVNEVINNY